LPRSSAPIAQGRLVGKILLGIGKAGHRLAGGEQRAVGAPGIAQQRRAMAERRRHLAGFVEGDEGLLQRGCTVVAEHRRLAAGHHDGVEALDIEFGQPAVWSRSGSSVSGSR
jgi:hypothetical protein